MRKNSKEKKSSPLKVLLPVIGLLVIALIVVYFFLLPKRQSFSSLTKGESFNTILITVDTLRADRINCYGFDQVETPTIDLFASKGIKFDKCIAQTPLTLPSHTSILTGTLPLYHGVRDNGGFLVPPDLTTLAELFKEKGYKTSAFVAAYVLDSKWGIDQGFDHYFDNFDLSEFQKISLGSVQRPANEVLDEALSWLEENKEERFFTWIHLYDPHTPYEPPPPYDTMYPGRPYIGEIAYTDSQLGRVVQFMEDKDLQDNTFLIFASDHGESLGEHQEGTHGFFVYQGAIHVPLIFVSPFDELQGISVPQVVTLEDIMPTILEMAEIPAPDQVQGQSLVPYFFEPDRAQERLAYAETFYPRFHFGWSELQSVQNNKFKLIIAPEMELYDLSIDPEERNNLASSSPDILEDLKSEAEKLIAEFSQGGLEMDYSKIDEETREKLAALGYIGSFSDSSKLEGKELANPKEKIVVFNQLSRAKEMGLEGNVEEATQMIKDIITDDPDIIDAYFTLGNIYFKNGKYEEAIANFREALDRKPDDTFAVINIANALRRMERYEEAEEFIIENLEKGLSDSQFFFILAGMKVIQEKPDEAIKYYKECLSLNASSSSSHGALAMLYLEKDDLVNAEIHVNAVIGMNPSKAGAQYNLALLLEKKGIFEGAKDAYKRELENNPRHFKASFNLSRLYRNAGQVDEEYKYLQQTLEINPEFPLSYFYLARIYLNRNERYEESIQLVLKGIELEPDEKDLPLGYFLLADLYNRIGNEAKAIEYVRKGRELIENSNQKL
jgi:arylsulfatase A-like enzyme/predicted Zn-dependent protease